MTQRSLARHPIGRRPVLAAGFGALLAGCGARPARPLSPAGDPATFAPRMAALEARFGGRIGVAGVDTATGAFLGHRSDERFLLCSTAKVPVVAAVFDQSTTDPGLLDRRVRWSRADLLAYAPATTAALDTGLRVADLCEAAITISDNTAANLLSALVGGPQGVTAYLRALGDATSRVDRTEPTLNDVAGDLDTSTPAAVVSTLRATVLGPAVPSPQRERLTEWMRAATTGAAQIRAGTPSGWVVADKTGSGAAGESNDVGVIWPPGRAPIVIAVYTAPTDPRNATGQRRRRAVPDSTAAATACIVTLDRPKAVS